VTRTPADVDAVAHVFVDALEPHVTIAKADGHHLQRVRRLAAGERITAADGSGAWRVYEIAAIASGRLELDACGETERVVAPAVRLAIAIALTKAGLDAVVPALTELGVATITPVRTERAVVRWDAAKTTHILERLEAAAREAAMQSRRADIPTIDALTDFDAIAATRELVLTDRGGVPASQLTPPASGDWTVLVGPEGGLSERELAALAPHQKLFLGPNVLRATTAPVAAASVLTQRIAQIA
jgi:16S rRNA (uracil1498-N3)-methyltransferase